MAPSPPHTRDTGPSGSRRGSGSSSVFEYRGWSPQACSQYPSLRGWGLQCGIIIWLFPLSSVRSSVPEPLLTTLIDSDQRVIELLELPHTGTHTHTALFWCVLISCTQDLDNSCFHLPGGHTLPAPHSEQPLLF